MDDETLTFESDQTIVLEAPATGTVHRIDIEAIVPVGLNVKAQRYRVTFNGEVLLESTKVPIFNSCRVLLARGCKGKLIVWGGEKYPRAVVDIERGAKLAVEEHEKRGPLIRSWTPVENRSSSLPEIRTAAS
jgi:hypothetical protein